MKKRTCYFLFFLFVITACKKELRKDPNTTLAATVIDFDTKIPIANAKVTLERYRCMYQDLMGGCGKWKKTTLKSEYTDENGNFSIIFYKVSTRTYWINIEKEGYVKRNLIIDEYFQSDTISMSLL